MPLNIMKIVKKRENVLLENKLYSNFSTFLLLRLSLDYPYEVSTVKKRKMFNILYVFLISKNVFSIKITYGY